MPFSSESEYNEYIAQVGRDREYEEDRRRRMIEQDRRNGYNARQHRIDYRESDNYDYGE